MKGGRNSMPNYICRWIIVLFVLLSSFLITTNHASATPSKPIIHDKSSSKQDMYPAIDIIKDRSGQLTIEDVTVGEKAKDFVPSETIEQKKGFFKTGNWLRFEID